MKKTLKSLKATLILSLFLVSILTMFMSPATAETQDDNSLSFLKLKSYIGSINYDENITNQAIVPRATGFSTQITLEYGVTYSVGIFNIAGNLLLNAYKGRTVEMQIEAIDYPEWASVTISNWPTVRIDDQLQYPSITMTVKLDENAPAFGTGDITLRVNVPKVGLIDGVTKQFEIPFSAAFIPLVQAQFPESDSKIIGPMDTAVFPIELQNMGNARTRVNLEVTGVPDGWAAVITNDVLIEEGKGSKSTVYLTIKPPKGFGYHDDTASIVIKYTPEMAENPEFAGETRTVDVLVESRGFSVIGIEIILIPIIVLIILAVILYQFVYKKIRK